MVYNMLGIFLVILGILQVIFTIHKKNNMPFAMFALQKEKYQVIDKENFNGIMLNQSVCIALWLVLIGTLCITIKGRIFIVLASCSVLINIIFSKKAKKYIKIK